MASYGMAGSERIRRFPFLELSPCDRRTQDALAGFVGPSPKPGSPCAMSELGPRICLEVERPLQAVCRSVGSWTYVWWGLSASTSTAGRMVPTSAMAQGNDDSIWRATRLTCRTECTASPVTQAR